MEGKKKGKLRDKDKNKEKDKEKEKESENTDGESQPEIEDFSVVEEFDPKTLKPRDTGVVSNGDVAKTPQESPASQTPKGTENSAPQTPKKTGTETPTPQKFKGTESSLPQTPKGAETPAPQTPKGPETLTPQTPKGPETPTPHTPKVPETPTPQTPKVPETPTPHTPKVPETPMPHTPKGPETPTPHTPKGAETPTPHTPKGIETASSQMPKESITSPQAPKGTLTSTHETPKVIETSTLGSSKQAQGSTPPLQKEKISFGSVTSKGTTKKISGEIEVQSEQIEEVKAVEAPKIPPGVVALAGGTGCEEVKGIEVINYNRPQIFSASLPPGFPCSPGLLQKRSPFIHNPPQPEERRERIPCPRTPREYIINLRENLADFQESHGLPRTRDYSFCSLGLALAQETGRAIFSLFHMFTELFPILAIVSLILRFALDKLIEILETNETGPKIKKSLIFALQMIAIVIPLWILIGTIILPLFGLVLTILKNMLRIKGSNGKKKTVVIQQKPKAQIKTSTSYK